jgi:hypothetical protein
MNKRTQILAHFLIAILFAGCYNRKIVPNEKLAIDQQSSAIFNSISKQDTIVFISSNGSTKKFKISEIDSIIHNKDGCVMQLQPSKEIRLKLNEVGFNTLQLKYGGNELSFIQDTVSRISSGVNIHFNNFRFSDSILPDIRHDTIILQELIITNYFLFKTQLATSDLQDVQILYVTPEKGFVAFETKSGEIWVLKQPQISMSNTESRQGNVSK